MTKPDDGFLTIKGLADSLQPQLDFMKTFDAASLAKALQPQIDVMRSFDTASLVKAMQPQLDFMKTFDIAALAANMQTQLDFMKTFDTASLVKVLQPQIDFLKAFDTASLIKAMQPQRGFMFGGSTELPGTEMPPRESDADVSQSTIQSFEQSYVLRQPLTTNILNVIRALGSLPVQDKQTLMIWLMLAQLLFALLQLMATCQNPGGVPPPQP